MRIILIYLINIVITLALDSLEHAAILNIIILGSVSRSFNPLITGSYPLITGSGSITLTLYAPINVQI